MGRVNRLATRLGLLRPAVAERPAPAGINPDAPVFRTRANECRAQLRSGYAVNDEAAREAVAAALREVYDAVNHAPGVNRCGDIDRRTALRACAKAAQKRGIQL